MGVLPREFSLLPGLLHRLGVLGHGVTEDVGMALDHLVVDTVDDILQGESSLLLAKLSDENHLEQQVAQLATELIELAGVDGRGSLMGFLEEVGAQIAQGLLAVPGATVRATQMGDQADELVDVQGSIRHDRVVVVALALLEIFI